MTTYLSASANAPPLKRDSCHCAEALVFLAREGRQTVGGDQTISKRAWESSTRERVGREEVQAERAGSKGKGHRLGAMHHVRPSSCLQHSRSSRKCRQCFRSGIRVRPACAISQRTPRTASETVRPAAAEPSLPPAPRWTRAEYRGTGGGRQKGRVCRQRTNSFIRRSAPLRPGEVLLQGIGQPGSTGFARPPS